MKYIWAKYLVKSSKNKLSFPNQSLFYSAAPQYGQRIRVTRMQRQQVIIKMKMMIRMKMIIKMKMMIKNKMTIK